MTGTRHHDVGPGSVTPTDVWAVLDDRLDPGRWRARMRPGHETARFAVAGGEAYVMLADSDGLTHYRLTVAEAAVLPLLDGTRTLSEIAADYLAAGAGLDAASLVRLVRLLDRGGFLEGGYVDVPAALERALHPLIVRRRIVRFVSTLSIEWPGAERLVRFLYRHVVRRLFTRGGLVAAVLIVIAGVVGFAEATSSHHYSIQNRHFGVIFAIFMSLDLIIIAIHELGHASVLVHYGRRVKSAGFRIYFGSPSFFIESSDGLMLTRERRMLQAAAGAGFEVVGTSIAAVVLWALPTGPGAHVLFQFVIINYFVLFLNLVPFLELDGYWIVSDALRMPDLRPDSLAFVRGEFWRKLAHRERLTRREAGLAAYGILGVLFTLAAFVSAWYFWRRVFGDTLLTMWHGGIGGKILLLVLLSFILGPVIRAVILTLRGLGQAIRAQAHRLAFARQRRWRVEAAELIDASGLFGDIPVEVLNDVAGRITLRGLPRAAVLIQQGTIAGAFYLVRSGTLEVVEDGSPHILRTVHRGEGVGEYGLLGGAPRTATVRAAVRSEVFALDKGSFERLLAARATVAGFSATLQQIAELTFLPPFAHLNDADLRLLAEQGSWINITPGDDIMTQGEPGDAFYAIATGRLDIIENGTTVTTRGPGEHVGELALLHNTPRNATVRASTPARLFRLDRDGFNTFLAAGFQRGATVTNTAATGTHGH